VVENSRGGEVACLDEVNGMGRVVAVEGQVLQVLPGGQFGGVVREVQGR